MEKVKLIIDNSINKIIMDTANDDKIKDLEKDMREKHILYRNDIGFLMVYYNQ